MELLARGGSPVAAIAKVVSNVPAAAIHLGVGVVKGPKDVHRALLEDVRHHVQASAMSHPHDDLL